MPNRKYEAALARHGREGLRAKARASMALLRDRKAREAEEGVRHTRRRPVELIAVASQDAGTQGLALAITVSACRSRHRRVIHHGDSVESLVWALNRAAQWVEDKFGRVTCSSESEQG